MKYKQIAIIKNLERVCKIIIIIIYMIYKL